jgi:hypothetical protein
VSQQYFVCSDHFIDSQFVDDSKQRLSRGAVPTVFDFNNQNAVPVEIIDGDEIVVEGEYMCVCNVCMYVRTYVCIYLLMFVCVYVMCVRASHV